MIALKAMDSNTLTGSACRSTPASDPSPSAAPAGSSAACLLSIRRRTCAAPHQWSNHHWPSAPSAAIGYHMRRSIMIDQFLDNDDNTQRRIRQNRIVINTQFGTLSIGRYQTTHITETGDIITDDSTHFAMLDGQTISSPAQIIGQCTNIGCGKFLTPLTFGYCVLCFQVRCPQCSVFDDIIGNWLCTECYAEIKKQRFWQGVRNFLTRPFRRG